MENLKPILKKLNITQRELAEKVGVSTPYMSELVGGTKTPSLPIAVAIERATKGKIKASWWVDNATQERTS